MPPGHRPVAAARGRTIATSSSTSTASARSIQGSSNLQALLDERGIDTLVIVGTLTNVCCESTARDAMMLNYRVIMVDDANATISEAAHRASLDNVAMFFGDVQTTEQVVAMLA